MRRSFSPSLSLWTESLWSISVKYTRWSKTLYLLDRRFFLSFIAEWNHSSVFSSSSKQPMSILATAGTIVCIEKWGRRYSWFWRWRECSVFPSGTVADICRYLRNFNGVLQIMAAFVNSSIYRLKQTWDRISKQNKQVINKLQSLVHSDGKFKNLRDTLTKWAAWRDSQEDVSVVLLGLIHLAYPTLVYISPT